MRIFAMLTLLALLTACTDTTFEERREAVNASSPIEFRFPTDVNTEERAIVEALYPKLEPSASKAARCELWLTTFWELAKTGNREARLYIAFADIFSDLPIIRRGADDPQIRNDFRTLIFHSVGARFWQEQAEKNNRRLTTRGSITQADDEYFNDLEFKKCADLTPSPACTQMAVDKGYIPTFAAFAAEIDRTAPNGIKQACAQRDAEYTPRRDMR